MTPTLIVLGLIALGVAIVAWATRRKPAAPYAERKEQDTAWNDPVTPTDTPADPFAHAPSSTPADPEPRP